MNDIDRWHYTLVLLACLVVTVPLEYCGARVYRRPARAASAILPVAAVFVGWDVLAVFWKIWSYNPRHVVGVFLPLRIPLEEVLFFLVIPLCSLLTYGCVESLLSRSRIPGRRSVR